MPNFFAWIISFSDFLFTWEKYLDMLKRKSDEKASYINLILFLIWQEVLDILIKAFSQMAMVWILLLVTLLWIITLYQTLDLIFHQRKTFQTLFSTSVTLIMETATEYHTYLWPSDSLWIMTLLMSYILHLHQLDAEAGI